MFGFSEFWTPVLSAQQAGTGRYIKNMNTKGEAQKWAERSKMEDLRLGKPLTNMGFLVNYKNRCKGEASDELSLSLSLGVVYL